MCDLSRLFSIAVIGMSCGWTAPRGAAAQVTVFAAASLANALKQVAADYETAAGDRVRFNFAASSVLARQISEGAPADIFFPADEATMDQVAAAGLVVTNTRASLLGNLLVIIVASDSKLKITQPADLASAVVKKLALADPKTVPAGIYARAWLEKLQLWPLLEPRIVPLDNVRAALAAVESGNVEVGIVYQTDAALSKNVQVAYQVLAGDGPVISYPVALLKEAPQPEAARRFLAHLKSPAARRVFTSFGFLEPKEEAKP